MHSRREGIIDGAGGVADRAVFRSAFRRLRHVLWPASGPESPRPLRSTAYLDGLRGFAAFLVYIHHHELWAHSAASAAQEAALEHSFGFNGEYYFAALPGVRNFFIGGHMAVAIFFVISGYVLSAKPLSLIQSGELPKLGDSLASSMFRRWLRLFIPLIVTTFVYITSWHLFGYWNSACEPKGTYREEVWNWYAEFKNFSFLFKEGHEWPSYNIHLWSIPLEMRGSVVIFTACLSFSRATTKARLLCEVFLIFYFMYIVDGGYCALFMMGMLQCDLDMLARRTDGYFPRFLRRLEPYKLLIYYHFFAVSMWLGGVPSSSTKVEDLRENPGWYWMSLLKPQAFFDYKWFYLFWSASMMVACVPRIRWLKRFFETRFCQYMARISYALYLVHGPLLCSIGDRVYHAVGYTRLEEGVNADKMAAWANIFPLPRTGPLGLEIAFLLPQIILLPLTLWVADVVTRMVDEPAVRFAAWLYKGSLGEGAEPKPEDPVALMRLA